ncbi:MAG: ABC transporter substrate-binding protein [Acidimicrobiia bacterium]|nr:ABC transporter substrate-binding protein [Acidimicrobiia bacterium]
MAGVPLRVCLFSGASSLPIRIADHLGLLSEAGLAAELHLTRGSRELVEGLAAGRYDVVHAAPDNFIEWSDRTGADIVSWIGGTSGPLHLIGSPELAGLADLAGRGIAVDSPDSGFVSILMKIVRAGGLAAEDVSLVPLGSTQLRYEALMAGRTAATMLALPWSAMALEAGFSLLGDRDQVLPGMQGSSGASLRTWLAAHPDTADSYLKALCAAITWLNHPANLEDANRYICETYGTSPALADAVHRSIMDPRTGWSPSAFIDPAGMDMVCRLRSENGRPPDRPATSYYTLEPYRRVFGFGLGPCAGEPPEDVEGA